MSPQTSNNLLETIRSLGLKWIEAIIINMVRWLLGPKWAGENCSIKRAVRWINTGLLQIIGVYITLNLHGDKAVSAWFNKQKV